MIFVCTRTSIQSGLQVVQLRFSSKRDCISAIILGYFQMLCAWEKSHFFWLSKTVQHLKIAQPVSKLSESKRVQDFWSTQYTHTHNNELDRDPDLIRSC